MGYSLKKWQFSSNCLVILLMIVILITLEVSFMLLEFSVHFLESSIMLLENIYSTGITHDDHQIFIVQATSCNLHVKSLYDKALA
jgi:hypothetical protein